MDDGAQGSVELVGDTQSLTCRLHTLGMHPDLARNMGSAGRKRAEEMDLPTLLARTFDAFAKAGWEDRS